MGGYPTFAADSPKVGQTLDHHWVIHRDLPAVRYPPGGFGPDREHIDHGVLADGPGHYVRPECGAPPPTHMKEGEQGNTRNPGNAIGS
jgi:hypothetical protein